MRRKKANWARMMKPLATSAVAAWRCDRAERSRWTIIWSAPWVAVFRTMPPIRPAQNV